MDFNEMETEILRYAMHNSYLTGRLDIPPECFLDLATRKCWTDIKDLHARDVRVTPVLLRSMGNSDNLLSLLGREAPPDMPIDEYANRLRERYAKHFLLKEMIPDLSKTLSNGVSPDAAMAKVSDYMRQARRYIVGDKQGENLEESQQAYFDQLLGKNPKIQSTVRLHIPIAGLRNAMPAAIGGTFVSLAAFTSYGKTVMLEQWSEEWARQGFNGVYFDLELPEIVKRQRRMMRQSGVSIIDQDMEEERPGSLSEPQRKAIEEAAARIATWPGNIQYVNYEGWSMDRVVALCERLNDRRPWPNGKPIHFVIVDYLDLIYPDADEYSKMEYMSDAILTLKNAGKRNNWVSVMAAQFDKASTKTPYPHLTDVVYAGRALATRSNVGFIIDRELSENGEDVLDQGQLRVDKATNGKKKRIPLIFEGDHLRFREAKS